MAIEILSPSEIDRMRRAGRVAAETLAFAGSEREILQSGDLLNVDVTTNLDGYHGDTSATFVIGEATADATRLVDVARRCRDVGIAVIREGARLGDIGAAIEELARSEAVAVVTADGSLSAQWEHTVIVTREGYEITTLA